MAAKGVEEVMTADNPLPLWREFSSRWLSSRSKLAILASLTLIPTAMLCIIFRFDRDYRLYSLGVELLVLCITFAIFRRPVFSLWLTGTLLGILWVASELKYSYLGSRLMVLDLPLAFSALETFSYFETTTIALALSAICITAVIGFREQCYAVCRKSLGWFIAIAALLGASITYATSYPLEESVYSLGMGERRGAIRIFLGSIGDVQDLISPAAEGSNAFCCMQRKDEALTPDIKTGEKELPNIVIVLEESTFQPPQGGNGAAPELFFPQAHPLHVHTVGGSTWSAEYAVLHGVPHPIYGPAGIFINTLGPRSLDGALPRILKNAGYRTMTISSSNSHYYSAAAFHRSLGIDEYRGCERNPRCAGKPWNEVPDRSAFEQIVAEVDASKTPVFIFATTIRQHSPHLPKEAYADIGPSNLPAKQVAILEEYRRRLRQSIDDFDWLTESLPRNGRPTLVIAFGDHIPSDVTKFFSETDLAQDRRQTFFTVFHSARGYITQELMASLGQNEIIDIAYLDILALVAAGIETRYGREKLAFMHQQHGRFSLSESKP